MMGQVYKHTELAWKEFYARFVQNRWPLFPN